MEAAANILCAQDLVPHDEKAGENRSQVQNTVLHSIHHLHPEAAKYIEVQRGENVGLPRNHHSASLSYSQPTVAGARIGKVMLHWKGGRRLGDQWVLLASRQAILPLERLSFPG